MANDQTKNPICIQTPDSFERCYPTEDNPMKIVHSRAKSGTFLPTNMHSSQFIDLSTNINNSINKLKNAKSSGDLLKSDDDKLNPMSNQDPLAKCRFSVSWFDSQNIPDDLKPDDVNKSYLCTDYNKSSINQSNLSSEDPMILFSPIDQLGYAQLLHQPKPNNASNQNGQNLTNDEHTSNSNLYSKFPTSFV